MYERISKNFFSCLILVASILFNFCIAAIENNNSPENSHELWLKDIDALDQKLRQHHPDPFFHTGEGAWLNALTKARKLVNNGASDAEISTQLMTSVAHLKDGHTRLEPIKIDGFSNWLPIRFYEFEEGIFVTVAAEDYADLIGNRLVSISGVSIEDVWEKVAMATAGDNDFQIKEGAAALLSNAGLLSAIGVIEDPSKAITLVFESFPNERVSHNIPTILSWYSVNYRNWGELFGPPFEPFDVYNTPFHDGKSPMAYRDSPNASDAPFYASRKPFWARLNNNETVLTFQFNYVAEIGDIGWDDFRKQMWEVLDRAQPDRFIIDLRFNFGGDGSMIKAFMNELMERPSYANSDRLVVLTGRQTFSAAIMLIAALKDRTDAIFIGEPAAAPLNHFGDPISFSLPSGRLELVVSTLYWQLGHPSNRKTIIPVNMCVSIRAHEYFAGKDFPWEMATNIDIAKFRSSSLSCDCD